MITNVHERELPAPAEKVGELLDQVAEPDNALWPSQWWWPIRLDGPLAVGAKGGHGPIRYTVVDHVPGKRVEFRFLPSMFGLSMDGSHWLEVVPTGGSPDRTVLRHGLSGEPTAYTGVVWDVLIGRMHDAVIEDMLDNAAEAFGGPRIAKWSTPVRVVQSTLRFLPIK